MTIELGRFGVWLPAYKLTPALAAEIEKTGYGAIWIGSSPSGDLELPERLLDATGRIVVGTSIVNVWKDDAAVVAASYHRLEAKHPGRSVLGIGVGHPEQSARYNSPYHALTSYLDVLDAEGVPAERRALAALRPKVLRLSAERSAGALPYLVTPAHTRQAREILGADVLLAPEHKVVLDEDATRARTLGRPRVQTYLELVNYTRNLRTLGYTDADLEGAGSDRLVDDLALHGSPEQVAKGLTEHLQAGADHVVVQLLTADDADLAAGYVTLFEALQTVD